MSECDRALFATITMAQAMIGNAKVMKILFAGMAVAILTASYVHFSSLSSSAWLDSRFSHRLLMVVIIRILRVGHVGDPRLLITIS